MVEAARRFLAALALAACATTAHGLASDKDQPIEVEADSAELDDAKKISIYRGNVVVTQGTIRMTGDVMTGTGGEFPALMTIDVEPVAPRLSVTRRRTV